MPATASVAARRRQQGNTTQRQQRPHDAGINPGAETQMDQMDYQASSSGGGAGGIIVGIIYLAVIVFLIASMWKVFTKAGQPGWAAIVPIYNIYVLTQIAGEEAALGIGPEPGGDVFGDTGVLNGARRCRGKHQQRGRPAAD